MEPFQLRADAYVVALKQLVPAVITQLSRLLRRGDDIREQDRRQHAIDRTYRSLRTDEAPDLSAIASILSHPCPAGFQGTEPLIPISPPM